MKTQYMFDIANTLERAARLLSQAKAGEVIDAGDLADAIELCVAVRGDIIECIRSAPFYADDAHELARGVDAAVDRAACVISHDRNEAKLALELADAGIAALRRQVACISHRRTPLSQTVRPMMSTQNQLDPETLGRQRASALKASTEAEARDGACAPEALREHDLANAIESVAALSAPRSLAGLAVVLHAIDLALDMSRMGASEGVREEAWRRAVFGLKHALEFTLTEAGVAPEELGIQLTPPDFSEPICD